MIKDWRDEVSISDSFKDQKGQIQNILKELHTMCNGHIGRLNEVEQLIEVNWPLVRPVH